MNSKIQILCASCGLIFVTLVFLGWWIIAGMVPAIPPGWESDQVAEFFQSDIGTLRLGLMIGMIGIAFNMPFTAIISIHLRRIEGAFPVLATTQAIAGGTTMVILMTPFVLWTVAAFRIDRAPEIILVLSDVGWFFLLMTFAPFFMQFVSIGLAILSDKSDVPIFPRWVAYFNIWVAILAMPGALITFFKSGPFAWNGLLAFWVPVAVFMAWFFVMFFVLLKVIKNAENA